MNMHALDWWVIGGSVLAAFIPAALLSRRASRGTAEFFASGRSAPWWLAGTSMVATTFATDTPNLVTELVRGGGVYRNWAWWAFLLSGMLTVFVYARLWRRSGALTDLEFYELRYAGRPASLVRGFRALYLGLIFNGFIMAVVTLAAVKIANVMLGWSPTRTVVFCGVVCVLFASMSGLWGVLAGDLVQFVIAMTGVIVAAWFALDHPAVGGLAGLVSRVEPSKLAMLPNPGDRDQWITLLVLPLAVQWWAVWYPGSEPGGGSYVAQRMLAAKNERHALGATLWFNVAHYALRPWPWIIVALASLLVYPTLESIGDALPHVDADLIRDDIAFPAMLTLLPPGWKGLLIASLFCAYVSTITTQLNWGASYLVHDLYRRFLRPDKSEKHYVWTARIATVALMLVAIGVMQIMESARDGFTLLLNIGAGTGLIYLLRWFWWRINAWSEITAMLVSFATAGAIFIYGHQTGEGLSESTGLLVTIAVTTVAWVGVTLLTAPADAATLRRFVEKVQPAGPGWRVVRDLAGVAPSPDSLPQALLAWTLGCGFVYAALFGTGAILYGERSAAIVCGVLVVVCGGALAHIVRRMMQVR